MGIRREDLVVGGYALFRTRYVIGGAAAQPKKVRVKVLEWDRGAATIEFEDKSRRLTPFHQLEADEDWLSEYREREAERKRRAKEEIGLVEAPLTQTLGDKLQAVVNPPQPEPEPEPEPAPPEPEPEPAPPEPAPESMPPEERKIAENLLDALGAVPFDLNTPAGKQAAAQRARAEIDKGRALVDVARELGVRRELLKIWMTRLAGDKPFSAHGRPLGVGSASPPPTPPTPPPGRKEKVPGGRLPPGRVTHVLTNEQAEEMARAVAAHELSWSEAQEMYKVGKATVWRVVHHFRKQWAAASQPQPEKDESEAMPAPSHLQYTAAQRAELARKFDALRAKGVFAKDAATKLGVTESALREWSDRLARGEPLTPRKRKDFSKAEQIAIALYLEADGKAPRDAEAKFGVQWTRASKYARNLRGGVYGDPKKLIADHLRKAKSRHAAPSAPPARPTIQASPPPPPPPPPEPAPRQAELWQQPEPQDMPQPQVHYPPPPQPYMPPIHVPPAPPPAPVYAALPAQTNGHGSGAQGAIDAMASERDALRAELNRANAEIARLRAANKGLLAALSAGHD